VKRKDLIDVLEQHGYSFKRNGGNHDIYTNGVRNIPVPRKREIKEGLARDIIRKLGQ